MTRTQCSIMCSCICLMTERDMEKKFNKVMSNSKFIVPFYPKSACDPTIFLRAPFFVYFAMLGSGTAQSEGEMKGERKGGQS